MYASDRNSGLATLEIDDAPRGIANIAPRTITSADNVATVSLSAVLARRWKYILFSMLVTCTAASAVALTLCQYTWTFTSSVLYHRDAAGSVQNAGLDIATLHTLLKARGPLEQIHQEFNLQTPLGVLDKSIEVEVPRNSSTLAVAMQGSDFEQTEAMLNRLVQIFVEGIDKTNREALARRLTGATASAARSRQDLARSQEALSRFTDVHNVINFEQELTTLRTGIEQLENNLYKQRMDQNELLTEKGKTVVLTTALLTNRAEAEHIQKQMASRRRDLERLKSVRQELAQLNDAVEAASAAQQRAEAELAIAQQDCDSRQSAFTLIQPAKPALITPVVSNQKKLFAATFVAVGLLLLAPMLLIELRLHKENPVVATARQLGLPLLVFRESMTRNSHQQRVPLSLDEEYARLLSLRLQQYAVKPGYVLMLSGLHDGPTPAALLQRLAGFLAERDHNILLIQVDAPSRFYQALSAPADDCPNDATPSAESRGLAGYLTGDDWKLDEFTRATTIPGVDTLLTGSIPLPREAFGTRRMSELLAAIRNRYSLILIAGPSAEQPVDLELLAARADGIVFHDFESRPVDARAIQEIRHLTDLGAPVLGIIG